MEHLARNFLIVVRITAARICGGVDVVCVAVIQRKVAIHREQRRHGARAICGDRQRLVDRILVGLQNAVLMEGIALLIHTAVRRIRHGAYHPAVVSAGPIGVIEHPVQRTAIRCRSAPRAHISVNVRHEAREPAERVDRPGGEARGTVAHLVKGLNGLLVFVKRDIAVRVRHVDGQILRKVLDRHILLGKEGQTEVHAHRAHACVVISGLRLEDAVLVDHTVEGIKANTAALAELPLLFADGGQRCLLTVHTVRPGGAADVRAVKRRKEGNQPILDVKICQLGFRFFCRRRYRFFCLCRKGQGAKKCHECKKKTEYACFHFRFLHSFHFCLGRLRCIS